ncbi:hypothetical protein DL770_005390 [Monosporascus sp. CRB-9-2]|nr:hypothetical protein DL770_005390 [Monosporascus sp. CRB-9-2]
MRLDAWLTAYSRHLERLLRPTTWAQAPRTHTMGRERRWRSRCNRSVVMDTPTPIARINDVAKPKLESSVLPPLARFLNFLVNLVGDLPGDNETLEPVRHLPLLGDGRVYSVRRDMKAKSIGASMVCKSWKRSLSPESNNQPRDAEFRSMLREIRFLMSATAKSHENIVSAVVIRFGITGSQPLELCPVFKLEEADFGDLTTFQSSAESIDFERRISLCADVAAGLSALHASGLVHGALEPSHVLIFRHDQRKYLAKLCGFGNLVVAAQTEGFIKVEKMSLWYAPETFEGCPTDDIFASDVFPLGLVLWQVLAHNDPFSVFDLPLDDGLRDAEIITILRQPYLFRFIPLLIEHSLGALLEDADYEFLDRLFTRTVRINPSSRSLEQVLEFLEGKTGRQIRQHDASAVDSPTAPAPEKAYMFDALEPKQFTVREKDVHFLPWIVKFQLLQNLRAINSERSATERAFSEQTILQSLWLEFSYLFHGIAGTPDRSGALACLENISQRGCVVADDLLLTIKDLPADENKDSIGDQIAAALQHFQIDYLHLRRPWLRRNKSPRDPTSHGITATEAYLRNYRSLASPSKTDVGGNNTLLHAACLFGHLDAVNQLLTEDWINIDAQNQNGDTPLLLACQAGRADIVQTLLQSGADASILNQDGESGLHWLVDTFSTMALLRVYQIRIETVEWQKQLSFFMQHVFADAVALACELHLFDMLFLLLERLIDFLQTLPRIEMPADLASRLDRISTQPMELGPFHSAYTQSTAILVSAISCESNTQRLYIHGKKSSLASTMTLDILMRFGYLLPKIVTRHGPVETLHYAITNGNEFAVRYLLALEPYHAQLDVPDFKGVTPVQEALKSYHFPILRLLAEQGATIDLRVKRHPRHGLTRVESSYMHVLASLRIRGPSFSTFLLDSGIPADIMDSQGLSALNMALYRCSFALAATLIEKGASLTREGPFDVTPLGEIFLPQTANICDDLVATLRFILSFDGIDGRDLFISNETAGYSAIHVAASKPSQDPTYRSLLQILLEHFRGNDQLDARAKTPAKSTALQIAIAHANEAAVELLLGAGADMDIRDPTGRNCLEVAHDTLNDLFPTDTTRSSTQDAQKLANATKVVRLLAEKSSWPGELSAFLSFNDELKHAAPLVERMRRTNHTVSYMRKLEVDTLGAISGGVGKIMELCDLPYLAMAKQLIGEFGRGMIKGHLEYFISLEEAPISQHSVLWCRQLSKRTMRDFQRSIVFEWQLDDAIKSSYHDAAHPGKRLLAFALSRDEKDLPISPNMVQYPMTLLNWYRWMLKHENVDMTESEQLQVDDFVSALLRREESLKMATGSVPDFDEKFVKFHFNTILPAEPESGSGRLSVILDFGCRCCYENVGFLSRHDMQRLTSRATSVDSDTWARRIKTARQEYMEHIRDACDWKKKFGIDKPKVVSVIQTTLRAENSQMRSVLECPKPDARLRPSDRIQPGDATWPKSDLPYQEINVYEGEIRLLTLHPRSMSDDTVRCTLAHFSLADFTDQFREYLSTVEESASPIEFENGWKQYFESVPVASRPVKRDRFRWGDYSALSYAWGSPSNTKLIIVNGVEISVGSNLEAALQVLRREPEFNDGLKLWVDAVCIDQNNVDEKSKVLPTMQVLYRVALSVTVWLGPGHGKKSSVSKVKRFLRSHVPDNIRLDSSVLGLISASVPDITSLFYAIHLSPALVDLMSSPYWKRLWIMQEITTTSLQRNVYVGDEKIAWNELIIFLYQTSLTKRTHVDDVDQQKLTEIASATDKILLLALHDEVYSSAPGLKQDNTGIAVGDWSQFLGLGSEAEVSDERDRVYGLLGLFPADISRRITPDYSKSVPEVFTDLSRAILESTGCYDELLVGSTMPLPAGLPTWALNVYDREKFHEVTNKSSGWHNPRKNLMDTGTLLPYDSYDIPDEWKSKFTFSNDSKVLCLNAVKVDTVDGVGGPIYLMGDNARIVEAPMEHSTRPLHEYGGSDHGLETVILRALSGNSNLVAHRKTSQDSLDGNQTNQSTNRQVLEKKNALLTIPWIPGHWPDAVMVQEFDAAGWSNLFLSGYFKVFSHFRRLRADFPLWHGRRFADYFPKSASALAELGYNNQEHVKAVKASLPAVSAIIRRTFLTTADRGYLGSTSVSVRRGDAIFVLPGCTYPVLLREIPGDRVSKLVAAHQISDSGSWYEVIGECYVEGLMNGECLEWVKNGSLRFEPIYLT